MVCQECGNETEGYDMYCKDCQDKYDTNMKTFFELETKRRNKYNSKNK